MTLTTSILFIKVLTFIRPLWVEPDKRRKSLILIERVFTVLEERPAVYPEWRRLVMVHSVMGVQVHDARIVALMNVHGVTHVLTLNDADFSRYAGITCMAPDQV